MRASVVRWILIGALGGGSAGVVATSAFALDHDVSVTTTPVRYTIVDGDSGKFRAHHWRKDGYAGGLQEFSGHWTLDDGTHIASEGHALLDENDFGAEFSVEKEALGFVDFDYTEFRKYFDGGAGVHRRFSTLQAPQTDRELQLDLGKFGFESGLTLADWPEFSFGYEREYKKGAKSRLSWTTVKEAGESRKIGPSWQEVDEIVDAFHLGVEDELAGFTFRGKQEWEVARSESLRQEQQLATTGVASDLKIRYQELAPESRLAATTLETERSFLEDKVFVASGYHYAHIRTREFETLSEYNQQGVQTNFTRPEQKPNSHANSDYDSHTWVGSVATRWTETLNVTSRLKSELISRHSNSGYNKDFNITNSSTGAATALNGVLDGTDQNLTESRATRWGEGFSVRFTGIPRTALYSDLELEQGRVLVREDLVTLDGPDTTNGADATNSVSFNRETVADIRRGAWTLGGRLTPWSLLDMTAHVRRRVSNSDYDDQRESASTSSSQRSAFIDGQSVHTNEFAARVTLKPCRWFRPSFRYQLKDEDYASWVEAQQIVKAGFLSHTYTFDVMAQPVRELVTTASFSRQTASTTTPAELVSTDPGSGLPRYNIPAFNADVNTWLFSADYSVRPNIVLTELLQYTVADNFNDFADVGLPYGADFRKLDLTTGITWSPARWEGTTVGANYGLFTYNPNENVEVGDYVAHTIWFEVGQEF